MDQDIVIYFFSIQKKFTLTVQYINDLRVSVNPFFMLKRYEVVLAS